jgi:hypothetical protein
MARRVLPRGRRHRAGSAPVAIVDAQYAPAAIASELQPAAARAMAAGARAPLTYLGAGATAIVFCDGRKHAFKVARIDRAQPPSEARANIELLRDEAEWMTVAATVPSVRPHIARLYTYHPRLHVIEKECIEAAPLGRRPKRSRWDLMQEIRAAMMPYGFGSPEYKDDSFVFSRGRGWVLVDAGFAIQVGARLVREAALVLAGKVPGLGRFDVESLAYSVRAEAGRTIAPARADRLSERLLFMAERMN